MNKVSLQGTIGTREVLRYMLSGAAVSEFTLLYQGEETEAGMKRKLKFSAPCIALGEIAEKIDQEPLGQMIAVKGFLAPSSHKSKKLLVHITEYVKGV